MKTDFVDRNAIAFSAQLKLAQGALPGYATLLKIATEDVAALGADSDYFEYCLNCQAILMQAAHEASHWKDLIRGGGQLPPTGSPVDPVMPAAVPAVAPGIEARFRALVGQIKASKNYNEAIGQALKIEGAEQTPPDYASLQPVLRVRVSGNAVRIEFGWQGYSAWLDLCELQVDRADGHGYVPLAFVSTNGCTDNQPFPATPTKWTYRAIFRVGNAQVGLWSLPVSVNVP